jgi:hypothetical protein
MKNQLNTFRLETGLTGWGEAVRTLFGHRTVRGLSTRSLVLLVSLLLATVPACDLLNGLGNAWCASSGGSDEGAGGDEGVGGNEGVGGDDGAGGGTDNGTGASETGATTGAGASDGTGAGDGAGAGDGDGAGDNSARFARRVPRTVRRSRAIRVQPDDCPPPPTPLPVTPPSFPAWTFPPVPSVIPVPAGAIPLTTTRLRAICTAQGVGAGLTGVQFSQACGLQFQDWVQWMLQMPQNTMPIASPERASHFVGGLPGAVIPDYVTGLKVVITGSQTVSTLPNSFFGEVKAVAGYLPPSYSQYQILGFLDVARLSPAGSTTVSNHPPPELVFTTTGNTKMSALTIGQANVWGVAIWQQIVYEDPDMPNDPNPDLCIDRAVPRNGGVYPPGVLLVTYRVNTTCTKLTSAPPNWALPIPGDPDPPTVDP